MQGRRCTAPDAAAAHPPAPAAVLEVPTDFQHVHAMLCLHVWLLLVRLRAEGKDGKRLAQMLYDDFQDDVEVRVRAAGVKVRGSRGREYDRWAGSGRVGESGEWVAVGSDANLMVAASANDPREIAGSVWGSLSLTRLHPSLPPCPPGPRSA